LAGIDKDRDFNRLQNFAYSYCRHVIGPMTGQPVLFEDWLADDLRLAYEVDANGRRVFTQVVLSYPKKHSKSLTTTICGLFELSPFRHLRGAPENYSLAGTKEQGALTLDAARKMLDPNDAGFSPRLAQLFTRYRSAIYCPRNNGKWTVLPHNADTVEGINPSFAACDEYATFKHSTLRDNVRSAMIARDDPLMLTISTKGDATDRPMYKLEQEMLKHPNLVWLDEFKWMVADRESGVLYISCGLPEDYSGDFDDPKMWAKVNRASWISEKSLRQEWLDTSTSEFSFRRKMLNQWVPDMVERGVDPADWDACMVEGARIPDGHEVHLMVDLGFTSDNSAVVVAGLVDGKIVVESQIWKPPGNGLEIDVRATVDKAAQEYAERFRVRHFAADKWNAQLLLQDWWTRGWPTHEFKMNAAIRVPASSMVAELIQKREIVHNGDPQLREHMLNLVKRETDSGWLFDKNKNEPSKKIDGAIALIGAVYLASTDYMAGAVYI
jgi:phage terminase large subunit-like protein